MVAVRIGKSYFKTKKESKKYTKNLLETLYNNNDCIIDKNHEKYNFLFEMIQCHPELDEKIGVGIKYFKITPNAKNKNGMELKIVRIDDIEERISWVCCSRNSFPKKDSKKFISDAMRNSIEYQIIEFKNSHPLVCQICGIDDDNCKYEVDHWNPEFVSSRMDDDQLCWSIFKVLRDNFLSFNTSPTKFDKDVYSFIKFRSEDYIFKNNWDSYHQSNAVLKILCKKCHKLKNSGRLKG